MKPEQYRAVREPSPALYDGVLAVAGGLLRTFCGYRSCVRGELPQGPLLVLCGHQGLLDFLLAGCAVPERRLHFVGSERFFHNGMLAPVLHAGGVIPKIQFHPDPRSILSIIKSVRAGGAVCLFPAGQTSMSGLPCPIDPVIVRLIRKAKAPVAAIRLHGGFFSMSRFASPHLNRGMCQAEVQVVLQPADLERMGDEEIYQVVCRAIAFDEYAWQAETGAQFRSRNRARGMDAVLYRCPKCGGLYGMRSRGSILCCRLCGNRARVGRDMRFSPVGDSRMPPTLTEWYLWQETQEKKALEDPGFCLESPVRVRTYDGRRFDEAGRGMLRLDRAGLRFSGELDGDAREISVRNQTLSEMVGHLGKFLELALDPMGPVQFYPEQGAQVARWKIVQELFRNEINAEREDQSK